MTARFICPHCHTAVAPHTMERAWSDLAEYRICPSCDEAIFFGPRSEPKLPAWLRRDVSGTPSRPAASGRASACAGPAA